MQGNWISELLKNTELMEKEVNVLPMVSIVVPVYNCEKFVGRCLNSIVEQTYPDWECIVIDDGSKDKSGEICDGFAQQDKRFRVIHKFNGGVGAARNDGINLASGKYITFVDADDYIATEYIEDLVQHAHHEEKESIIVSGMITKTPTRQYVSFQYQDESTFDTPPSELIVKYDLFRDGGPCNKLYNLEVIRENNLRFSTQLSYHEDHIFVYSYYLHIEHIILSNYCGYYYAYHGEDSKNSLSRIGKRNVKSLFTASDIFLSIVPKLFSKYNIIDEKYKRTVITRTGYSQRILALFNLYMYSNYSLHDKKRILHAERDNVKLIKDCYYPLSFKRRLFIHLLSLPTCISHNTLLLIKVLLLFYQSIHKIIK